MASTPSIQVSQADVASVSSSASDIQISQADTLAVFNVPSLSIEVSQADAVFVSKSTADIQISQADVIMIYRGRVEDPRVVAWTFTLDGHDYYVLRLGTQTTLVYDTFSRQWYVWGSDEGDLWRAYHGTNWRGALRHAEGFGSEVVVGDDGNGSIYLLNPNADTDDDALLGDELQRPFRRRVVVQAVLPSGYDFVPCFGIQAFGSVGQTEDTLAVSLDISDDRGQTYFSVEDQTVPAGDTDYRLEWLSLGSMRAPGRLFRVSDMGALRRIDGFHMYIPDDD